MESMTDYHMKKVRKHMASLINEGMDIEQVASLIGVDFELVDPNLSERKDLERAIHRFLSAGYPAEILFEIFNDLADTNNTIGDY